jgi:hypothetical protein
MANLRSISSLASLATLLLGSACVGQGELSGPPYEVVVLNRADSDSDGAASDDPNMAAEAPVFELQRRRLETIEDFDQLSAPAFRIRQGGTLTINVMHGDNVVSGAFRGGSAPDLRYVVEDGVAVPRDYATLLMFSAAYQFERISAGLRLASSPSTRAALDAHGSLETIFAPTTVLHVNGLDAKVQENTNAFFFPGGWQFGLAQSSPRERAPFAADARIIAHELGHAVFQLSFFQGENGSCKATDAADNADDPWFEGRLEEELAIGGLNEGFADWMSFAITGSTNVLESVKMPEDPELGQNVPTRVLNEDNFRWSQILKEDGKEREDTRCRGKYCLGTLFARSLVASYLEDHDASDEAARHEFSVDVVSSLERAQDAMRTLKLPAPESRVAHCEYRDDVSSDSDPPVIGAFLEAFLRGVPADTRASLCRQLNDRFEDGFPSESRKECAP